MNPHDIALRRLNNQQLVSTEFSTAKQMVHWLGVLQAQDYAMAKWAIGSRLPGSTDESIEEAIHRGEIIRTHLLRPTWHFVAAEDIRWMLQASAPSIKAATTFMNRQLGLDEGILKKTNKIIAKELAGKQMTRAELMVFIQKKGIAINPLRAAHIMLWAELDGIVCNGSVRDNQFTYALLDERVNGGKVFHREEALAQLAFRYFASHGPATLKDFAWWSGLSVANARSGLEAIKSNFATEVIQGQVYWFPPASVNGQPAPVYLLPAYDEFMVSYKDRTASLDKKYGSDAISGNGIFKPIIVVQGKVVGTWKRRFKNDTLLIETLFFTQKGKPKQHVVKEAADALGRFLSKHVELQKTH